MSVSLSPGLQQNNVDDGAWYETTAAGIFFSYPAFFHLDLYAYATCNTNGSEVKVVYYIDNNIYLGTKYLPTHTVCCLPLSLSFSFSFRL